VKKNVTGRSSQIFVLVGISQNSLKIHVSIHDWTSEEYVPLDILNMCRSYFGLPGIDCIQDPKTAQEVGRRRRPTSSAVFSSFVQSFPGSPK